MAMNEDFEKFIVSDEWVEIRGNASNSDELAEGVYKFAAQHYERENNDLLDAKQDLEKEIEHWKDIAEKKSDEVDFISEK